MSTNKPGWMDRLRSTPDGQRLLERERVWVEATENLCALMEIQRVTRADLASRLGVSRPWITQMLSGTKNLTLGTLADAFHALGRSLHVTHGPPTESMRVQEDVSPPVMSVHGATWVLSVPGHEADEGKWTVPTHPPLNDDETGEEAAA